MQVNGADAIEEIEVSPPQHDVPPPIEIIWDDDKIEKVSTVFLTSGN
jgi:hypothetical protein